jgi:hypothetical protein
MEKKYSSLESRIRGVMTGQSRGTKEREKVRNVARPDDEDPKSSDSSLSRTGQIKIKVIDEAIPPQYPQVPPDQQTPQAQTAQQLDDPKELKGGVTDVDFNPETDDRNLQDSDKSEERTGKKALKKANAIIGQKGAPRTMKESILAEAGLMDTAKSAGSTVGKLFNPVVRGLDAYSAYNRANQGDYGGAAIDAVAAVAPPGLSGAASALNSARDVSGSTEAAIKRNKDPEYAKQIADPSSAINRAARDRGPPESTTVGMGMTDAQRQKFKDEDEADRKSKTVMSQPKPQDSNKVSSDVEQPKPQEKKKPIDNGGLIPDVKESLKQTIINRYIREAKDDELIPDVRDNSSNVIPAKKKKEDDTVPHVSAPSTDRGKPSPIYTGSPETPDNAEPLAKGAAGEITKDIKDSPGNAWQRGMGRLSALTATNPVSNYINQKTKEGWEAAAKKTGETARSTMTDMEKNDPEAAKVVKLGAKGVGKATDLVNKGVEVAADATDRATLPVTKATGITAREDDPNKKHADTSAMMTGVGSALSAVPGGNINSRIARGVGHVMLPSTAAFDLYRGDNAGAIGDVAAMARGPVGKWTRRYYMGNVAKSFADTAAEKSDPNNPENKKKANEEFSIDELNRIEEIANLLEAPKIEIKKAPKVEAKPEVKPSTENDKQRATDSAADNAREQPAQSAPEQPKVEQPKVDEKPIEQPKVDEKPVEQPKVDEKPIEQPKVRDKVDDKIDDKVRDKVDDKIDDKVRDKVEEKPRPAKAAPLGINRTGSGNGPTPYIPANARPNVGTKVGYIQGSGFSNQAAMANAKMGMRVQYMHQPGAQPQSLQQHRSNLDQLNNSYEGHGKGTTMSENKNMPGLRPMLKSDNRFGVSDALYDAVKSVMEADKTPLQMRIEAERQKKAEAEKQTGQNNLDASERQMVGSKNVGDINRARVDSANQIDKAEQGMVGSKNTVPGVSPTISNVKPQAGAPSQDPGDRGSLVTSKPVSQDPGDRGSSVTSKPVSQDPGDRGSSVAPNQSNRAAEMNVTGGDARMQPKAAAPKPAAPNAAKPAAPAAPAAPAGRQPNWMERTFGGGKTEAPVDYNDQSPLGALRQYDAAKKAGTLGPMTGPPTQGATPAAKPAAPIASTTAPAAKPASTPPPRPATAVSTPAPAATAPAPTPKVNIATQGTTSDAGEAKPKVNTTSTMSDAGEAKPKPEEEKKPAYAREEYDLFSENEIERVKQIASRIK